MISSNNSLPDKTPLSHANFLYKKINSEEHLDDGKGGDWKTGLKLNIQKTKIMASCTITSWQIDGETVETVAEFILGAPKSVQMVTTAMKLKDDYSLEGKLWPT